MSESHPPLLKRPFDILVSGLGLLLSAPFWVLFALSIKLEDGGPVFYSQERVGKSGRRFKSWKFRSMVADSDQRFGPRPLLPEEIEVGGNGTAIPLEQVPRYQTMHQVKPGLTGMAQVYAPRDLPRRSKFRLDCFYIEKQSFLLDLKLILLSFWITLRRKWGQQEPRVAARKLRY